MEGGAKPNITNILVFVKEVEYDEKKDGWVYKVQEQDEEGLWWGEEKWKRETALQRA